MADIDLKTSTPDTSLPTTGFLFGADSQSAASPSVYSTQAVATALLGPTTPFNASITADAPVLNLAQTWNASGVTFTGLKFNAAGSSDANSAAGSLLMDLQVGGSSKFNVSKTGVLALNAGISSLAYITGGSNSNGVGIGGASLTTVGALITGSEIRQRSVGQITWTDTTAINSSLDTFLTRRAAANLRLGAADAAAPVAQTLSVQSGTAGASALSCSISGTTLTVGGAVTGTIAIGHAVTGTGVSAGTVITAGSGTTWTVNNSQTVSSTTMYFNSVGANLTITGSQGSGPSAGGSIVFQVAPAGSAGTTAQNALATALTIDSTRLATFAGNLSVPVGSFICTPNLLVGSGAAAGLYLAGGDLRLYVDAATAKMAINNSETAIKAASTFAFSWTNASDASGTPDVLLRRDNTGILALRNGANAQTFRVYNTTDGTNSEFGKIAWSSNVLQIGTEKAGTGTARAVDLVFDGTARFRISAAAITVSGDFSVGTWLGLGGTISAASSNGWIKSQADGVIGLYNNATTDFNRLQFGGTTSSFPALKRSSTTLQARLADDSAFAPVQGKLTTDTAYAAGDPTTTGYLVVYDSTGTAYKIPAVAV